MLSTFTAPATVKIALNFHLLNICFPEIFMYLLWAGSAGESNVKVSGRGPTLGEEQGQGQWSREDVPSSETLQLQE